MALTEEEEAFLKRQIIAKQKEFDGAKMLEINNPLQFTLDNDITPAESIHKSTYDDLNTVSISYEAEGARLDGLAFPAVGEAVTESDIEDASKGIAGKLFPDLTDISQVRPVRTIGQFGGNGFEPDNEIVFLGPLITDLTALLGLLEPYRLGSTEDLAILAKIALLQPVLTFEIAAIAGNPKEGVGSAAHTNVTTFDADVAQYLVDTGAADYSNDIVGGFRDTVQSRLSSVSARLSEINNILVGSGEGDPDAIYENRYSVLSLRVNRIDGSLKLQEDVQNTLDFNTDRTTTLKDTVNLYESILKGNQ